MAGDARSGVAVSGVTRSGDFVQSFTVQIAGVDRTSKVWSRDTTITDILGSEPSRMTGKARGFAVSEGQAIKVYNGGIDVGVPYFAGHILQVRPASKRKRDQVVYNFEATDYTWRMNQYARITAVFKSIGVNVLVRTILATYTEGGFVGGYLPSSLGDIEEMQFTNETVSNALDRIAERVDGGAYWSVDYQQRVSMWPIAEDDPHVDANGLSVVDGDSHREPKYDIDLSQIRTRVICEGGGSATTAVAVFGAATISVEECGWYSSSGGTCRVAQDIITYTGRSVASGPGTLTGVSGITKDVSLGEIVVVRAQADDSAAQTALAALIGGSGIAVEMISDGRLGLEECERRAAAELEFYDTAVREYGYTVDDDIHTVAGRTVSINVTKPATVNTDLRVQQVVIRKRSKVTGSTLGFERQVTASPVRVVLADILRRIA